MDPLMILDRCVPWEPGNLGTISLLAIFRLSMGVGRSNCNMETLSLLSLPITNTIAITIIACQAT